MKSEAVLPKSRMYFLHRLARLRCRAHNLALRIAEFVYPFTKARQCPICSWKGLRFRTVAHIEYQRRDAICPRCGSFERHRALAQFYAQYFQQFGGRFQRTIHFAAEECLRDILTPWSNEYLTSNLDPGLADIQLDLTRLALPDCSCDVLLLNHVLDCMPNDLAATKEMFRVLRPGGVVLAVIEYNPGIATVDRPASNGQFRCYGGRDISSRFAPFNIEVRNLAQEETDPAFRRICGMDVTTWLLILTKNGQR